MGSGPGAMGAAATGSKKWQRMAGNGQHSSGGRGDHREREHSTAATYAPQADSGRRACPAGGVRLTMGSVQWAMDLSSALRAQALATGGRV